MSDTTRVTRPKLERDHARREPLGFPPSSPDSRSESDGAPAEGGRGSEAISRGVELGYRVIDEYVRQGTRMAQTLSGRESVPGVAGSDVRQLSERMFEYASEAATIWLELFGMLAGRAAPADGSVRPETPAPAPPPPAHERSFVRPAAPALAIALDSARPVEVALQLHAPGAAGALRVHALRAAPGGPRLENARIEADAEGRPRRLCVRVPDTLPAGTYSGLIIDERTNVPAGTLCVIVGADETR